MATTKAFDEEVEAAIVKVLRNNFSFMKTSEINKIAMVGSQSVALEFRASSKRDTKGVRSIQFLELPRELRDLIYTYTVTTPRDYSIGIGLSLMQSVRHHNDFENDNSPERHGQQPAITKVSKQVRHESLSMYYKFNHFTIGLTKTISGRWLGAIQMENMKTLKRLTIAKHRERSVISSLTLPQYCAQEGVVIPDELLAIVKYESF